MAKKYAGINRRKDGRYAKDITIGGKRKTIYGETQQEVFNKIKALQSDYEQGRDIHSKPLKLAEFLLMWLTEIVSVRNKPRTQMGYTQIVNTHLIPEIGYILLNELTHEHIQALVNKLSITLAPRTVRNIRACLRRALNHALKLRKITYNPAQLIEMPKAKRVHVTFLNYEQANTLLKTVEGTYWHIIYRIALELGLREGEILGLYKTDINLDTATLTLTGTLQDQGRKLVREPFTKSDDVPTVLSLSSMLVWLLREHLAQNTNSLFLFSENNKPISPYKLTWWFQKHLKQAGLPRMRFHDLRHSCASFLVAEGEHPRVVMEHLRHKSFQITMDMYSHIMPSEQRKAGARIASKLDNPRQKSRQNENEDTE